MEALGHGAIRCRQLGDLREHVAFPVRLVRSRLPLLDPVLHRASFLVREFRDGALGGLLRVLHWLVPPLRVLMGTTLILGSLPRPVVSKAARFRIQAPGSNSVPLPGITLRLHHAPG